MHRYTQYRSLLVANAVKRVKKIYITVTDFSVTHACRAQFVREFNSIDGSDI